MPTTSKLETFGPVIATGPMEQLRLDPLIRNQAQRVHSALRIAILDGLLPSGTALPSSRALSRQIGIGRNTIVAAYELLVSDGLAEARHGSGTFVAPVPPLQANINVTPVIEPRSPAGPKKPFALGQPRVEPALLNRLAAASRRRISDADPFDLGYGDPRGSLHLRRQIAAALAIDRGLRCDPDCIVIVSGTQHGLRLCMDALVEPGDRVWMEEPGYAAARTTLLASGAVPVPINVDEEGLDIRAGRQRAPDAKAAYVTPSHQFPSGVRMSMSRRVELLDWAENASAWVLEDDYDSEFRYTGRPLTALAGLSSTRVIYLGTFAKTLFPALRIGYVVVPPDVLGRVLAARAAIDRFPPAFMQDALADLMSNGTVSAHLRRMRKQYRHSRDRIARILIEEAAGVLTPIVPEQGLHMIVRLASNLASDVGRKIRAEAGVEALLLSETQTVTTGIEAFVLGFSGFAPEVLSEAASSLARAARKLVE